MAEIQYVRERSAFRGEADVYTWANVTENDTCQPIPAPRKSDKTVSVIFDAGVSPTIVWEGSLDPLESGSGYLQLTDPQGNPISFGADGVATVLQNAFMQRPRVSAGSGVDATIRLMIV